MNKRKVLIVDSILSLVVLLGFEVIDRSMMKLEDLPFYYDFLLTAKWLLIGGFTLHAVINWLISKPGR